jgi:hypothetical protein
MYRPPNTRTAMMIKTVNMARSFDEPEGPRAVGGCVPGFYPSAYTGNNKLAM